MIRTLSHRVVGLAVAMTALSVGLQANTQIPVSKSAVQQFLNQNSIPFIENTGQKHADVAFYARTHGGALFVNKRGELVYALRHKDQAWAFKERILSSKALKPTDMGQRGFALQRQSSQGVKPLVTTDAVSLGEIANGIRVELHARANNVEKLFFVEPGASAQHIQVKLEGIQASQLDAAGKLVIDTGLGPVAFSRPVAFQMIDEQKHFVDVAYVLKDDIYGFQLGAYDSAHELVIDPLLTATYLGGGDGYPTYSYDNLTSLIVDGDYIYAAGGTHSPDFPTVLGGFDAEFDSIREGYVVRMTADLTTLVNATFIGGTVYDMLRDSNGELIVAGQAYSGFPKTVDAYSYPSDYEQTGGFIARLSADLSQLVTAGVVVPATISRIAMANGDLYFSGSHNQDNLAITPGAFGTSCNCVRQGSFGSNTFKGYLGRITVDLTSLQALSWVGGSTPNDIAASADGSVYINHGAFTTADGAVRKFDANLTTLLASQSFAYLGADHTIFGDMLLGPDFVLVSGSTKKNNLPATPGAFDMTCGTDGNCNDTGDVYYIAQTDGFLVRYSLDLQSIEALTYFGGSGHDSVGDMVLDNAGNILFTGVAGDGGVPLTSDAEQKKSTSRYLARISNDLTTLQYATYLSAGGTMTPAGGDNIYFYGSVNSSADVPVGADAFDTTYNGGATDGYIALYQIASSGDTGGGGSDPDPVPGDNIAPVADAGTDQYVIHKTTVTLDGRGSNDADGSIVQYQWRQISGKSVSINNADQAVASFTAPRTKRGRTRTLEFELTVTDNLGASDTDRVVVYVTQ